jgi:hypothetical protein
MKMKMRIAAGLASGILLLAGGALLPAGCREKAKPGSAEIPRPLVTGVR